MIAAGVASTTLFQEEVSRKERMTKEAAEIQANLFEQLTVHQRRLQVQGERFRLLAARVGVAIFVADADGRYTFRMKLGFNFLLLPPRMSIIKQLGQKY